LKGSPYINLGGELVNPGATIPVYKANQSITSSIQSISKQTVNQFRQVADACGGGICGSSTYLMPEISKAKLPMSTGLFDLDQNAGWAKNTEVWYSDEFYLSPRSLCCTDDIPMLRTDNICCEQSGIATLYLGYQSCIHDYKQYCGSGGYELYNPEGELQRRVMEALAFAACQIMFNGDASENITGLANNPRYSAVLMPNILTSSPTQILAAISSALSVIRSRQTITINASGNYETTRLVMAIPAHYYDYLEAYIIPGTSVTLLQQIQEKGCACPTQGQAQAPSYKLSVLPIPELNLSNTGYIFELGNLVGIAPTFTEDGSPSPTGSRFIMLPSYPQGLQNIVIAWCRVGGVIAKDYTKVVKLRF
jgi:hypothetical protein